MRLVFIEIFLFNFLLHFFLKMGKYFNDKILGRGVFRWQGNESVILPSNVAIVKNDTIMDGCPKEEDKILQLFSCWLGVIQEWL